MKYNRVMTDPACESLFLVLQRLGRLKGRRSDSVREPDIIPLKLVTDSEISNLSNSAVHANNGMSKPMQNEIFQLISPSANYLLFVEH